MALSTQPGIAVACTAGAVAAVPIDRSLCTLVGIRSVHIKLRITSHGIHVLDVVAQVFLQYFNRTYTVTLLIREELWIYRAYSWIMFRLVVLEKVRCCAVMRYSKQYSVPLCSTCRMLHRQQHPCRP